MPGILLIETATEVCSVALVEDGVILSQKESTIPNVHSTHLTVFIEDLLNNQSEKFKLNAVAVSIGPGSYTGLRIGLSVAKGLCYSMGIPLIAISTLQALALGATQLIAEDEINNVLLCPMLDARRMEVYSGIYYPDGSEYRQIAAEIIDETSFREVLENHKIYFFGSGMEKCKSLLHHPNAFFLHGVNPSAVNLAIPAQWMYADSQFSDIAYTEPIYLKEFYTKPPKSQF